MTLMELRSLDINGLRRFSFSQLGIQEPGAAVAAEHLDGLLLYCGGSDTQVLQPRQPGKLHVCGVELQQQSKQIENTH